MKVITTHVAADFDAFASAVCLRRVFPDHEVVFPGSLEVAVRRYLADTDTEVPALRLRDARREPWEHVVVVDTQSPSRLGEAWTLAERSGCPVTVVDHHDGERERIPADEVVYRAVGSTCTIVVELFQRHGVEPSPDEASLLVMGIYEDTGSLTYPETSPADLLAVSWLLERGARLESVRRWVVRTLEPAQLELLNTIILNAESIDVRGIRLSLASAEVDRYLEEAAAVVQRWVQMYDLPAAAALLSRPPFITVILRSQVEQLDMGEVAQRLGGGGHPTAASARVRDRSLNEVREAIVAAVRDVLPSPPSAGDIAVRKVFSVDAETTVAAAKERLNHLRINALPVRGGQGRVVGTVSRQTLDMGLGHQLGDRPVTTVMQPGVEMVDAATSLEEVRDLFLRSGRRFVLVSGVEGEPAGLITRMDLLRHLYSRQSDAGESLDNRMEGARPSRQSVVHLLRRVAPGWVWDLFEVVRRVADGLGVQVYLVGGAVRDLLLERQGEDIDLVVEGDGIEFAEAFAAKTGGRAHPHRPFLSAVVMLPAGQRVDVVSARTEFYRTPAALPEVETSLIRQDLFRRDFSINAMAVALAGSSFGQLLDFFGSRRDLRNKEMRALHSLSFIDDPTRAIRAARYVRRLGFSVAQETRHLILVAVDEGVFDMLSGERLRHELELLLAERHPSKSLALLADLGVIGEIVIGLEWSDSVHSLMLEIQRQVAWLELELPGPLPDRLVLYVGSLAASVSDSSGQALARRLRLTGRRGGSMAQLNGEAATVEGAAHREERLSQLVEVVERVSLEASILAMARLGLTQRRMVASSLVAARRVQMPLSGRDLLRRGVPSGPAIGNGLRAARRALIDGMTDVDRLLDLAVQAARSSL